MSARILHLIAQTEAHLAELRSLATSSEHTPVELSEFVSALRVLLAIHGRNDGSVSLGISDGLFAALRGLGAELTTHVYPNETAIDGVRFELDGVNIRTSRPAPDAARGRPVRRRGGRARAPRHARSGQGEASRDDQHGPRADPDRKGRCTMSRDNTFATLAPARAREILDEARRSDLAMAVAIQAELTDAERAAVAAQRRAMPLWASDYDAVVALANVRKGAA